MQSHYSHYIFIPTAFKYAKTTTILHLKVKVVEVPYMVYHIQLVEKENEYALGVR